jgi:hypothetical protein
MGLIREEVLDAAHRGRELIAAGIVALAGLWLMWLGGYLLFPLGAVILAICAVWAVQTWRRLRFSQDLSAPGMVEVDEGQVGYLGPTFGGFVALPDLVELRILTMQGQRLWRLKQSDGQALLIPVSAAGAERLFDAFASLPGMDSQALVAAAGGNAGDGVVWRRGRGTGNLRLVGN